MNATKQIPRHSAFDVTVVTVVYNAVESGRAEAFRACLDSVQAQTGCRVEHVIVDGASADGTLELLRAERGERRAEVRVVSERDSGIYEAMNRGISLARGKYVVFLNSDDFFHDPKGLAESVRELEDSGADFSYAPAAVVDVKGDPVPHAFTLGRPYQMSAGMTICHQSMVTRRDTLVRMNGFDARYRSAADYDLLLRMIFADCRACRVATPFVTFRLGGFSTANAKVVDHEVAVVIRDNFNPRPGPHLTVEDCERIRQSDRMPEALACRLAVAARRTFGEWYCLSEEQRTDWRNLLAGQLQDQVLAWTRCLRVPNLLKRWMLAAACRGCPALGERTKAADLDFMYRYVQRVQAAESGIDERPCVETQSGLASFAPMNLSFPLNDWLRNRAVRLGLLLRVDATGGAFSGTVRISCGGRVIRRRRLGTKGVVKIIDVRIPASCNTGDEMRLRLELVDGNGVPLRKNVGAALVYGGLAVWG